jgi:hypothetical protein
MYIPVWLIVLVLLYLFWQARQPRPTLAEYRAEKEARQKQRAAHRALARERRAQARLLLQTQNRRKMAIIRSHPWHTTFVLALLVIAGVLIWSVPPKVNPKAEPAWQAWPVALIALILLVYLWSFDELTKKANGEGEPMGVLGQPHDFEQWRHAVEERRNLYIRCEARGIMLREHSLSGRKWKFSADWPTNMTFDVYNHATRQWTHHGISFETLHHLLDDIPTQPSARVSVDRGC